MVLLLPRLWLINSFLVNRILQNNFVIRNQVNDSNFSCRKHWRNEKPTKKLTKKVDGSVFTRGDYASKALQFILGKYSHRKVS